MQKEINKLNLLIIFTILNIINIVFISNTIKEIILFVIGSSVFLLTSFSLMNLQNSLFANEEMSKGVVSQSEDKFKILAKF